MFSLSDSKTNRDMIIETNRDVKWICRTLAEMKGTIEDHEGRLRNLEAYKAESGGRESKIAAGLGAGAGGAVAFLIKLLQ